MFGFGPISSTSISGSPFKLIAVPLSIAAVISFEFGGTPTSGVISRMSASVGMAFGITARLFVSQAISGTMTITFGGTSNLRLAGKPIVISAISQSFTLRAPPDSYTLKATSEHFTIRGVR